MSHDTKSLVNSFLRITNAHSSSSFRTVIRNTPIDEITDRDIFYILEILNRLQLNSRGIERSEAEKAFNNYFLESTK